MKTKLFALAVLLSVTFTNAQKLFKEFSNFYFSSNNVLDKYEKTIDLKNIEINFEDEQGNVHEFSDFLFFSDQEKLTKFPIFHKDKSYYYLQITDQKSNGYIYLYDIASGKFEKNFLFEDEPTWTKTFFGKSKNGNPLLYHIDSETNFIYQSYLKNGQWKIHRTFPLTDRQLEELFLKQPLKSSAENPNTFDVDMDIEDSYFRFLEWKSELESNPKYYKEEAIHYSNDSKDSPFFIPECWRTQKTTESDVMEIGNMPPIKIQNTMGECRAFSLAVVIQKFICENSKNQDGSKRYIDCSNPPPDKAISYFGMMAYTNSVNANLKSVVPNVSFGPLTYAVIKKISDAGDGYIFEACKPFDEMASKFSVYNDGGDKKAEEFLNYTKDLFQKRSLTNIDQMENCEACLEILSEMTGFEKNQINLQKALTKKSYEEFLFTLLFADCKFKDTSRGFRLIYYPISYEDVSNNALKAKVIEGLSKGIPVLIPNLYMKKFDELHSVVVSGYKKIYCDSKYVDSFKIHNSWGKEWQKLNNDGWVSADILLDNLYRNNGMVQSGSIIWLE